MARATVSVKLSLLTEEALSWSITAAMANKVSRLLSHGLNHAPASHSQAPKGIEALERPEPS